MAATEVELVTVTFDGREVHVPPGTPLVVAAAHVGVEIPVFCYEPRLGPPVGACRMCLVEVEMGGRPMPKLQAACTLTAADGMVVKTGATSDKARDGQDAVLEFLLLNHPLDCPVCDKGGECPLQDLTFRYGPGKTRMTLPKRTYEKPLPISPSIVLDRERCILCYRCTRFSSDVAEDGELIARERGAQSVIATFQEQPYTGAFSGNVTELCPVGALLPTPYRFRARPWEIVNVPTVCQGCPTGCNTWVTVREGTAERILSRNHPEVDDGWLCDRGRFARHEPRSERLASRLVRGERGLEEVSLHDAATTAAARLRHVASLYGPGAVAFVTAGDLTNEEADGLGRLARELGARTACGATDQPLERLDAYAARIDDLDRADLVVVVGDAEVADRAGVVDLRIRKARRAGAHLVVVGPGGASLERDASGFLRTAPGAATAALAALVEAARDHGGEAVRRRPGTRAPRRGQLSGVDALASAAGADAAAVHALGTRLATAERPLLIVTDEVGVDHLETAAYTLSLDRRGGLLPLPRGANERGCRAAGLGGGGEEILAALEAGDVQAVVLLGVDPTAEWPHGDRWQVALAQAEVVVTSSPFVNTSVSWSHVVFPSAVDLEREGTTTNLEGRVQRLHAAVPPPSGIPDLHWIAAIGDRLGVAIDAAPRLSTPGRAPLAVRASAEPAEPPYPPLTPQMEDASASESREREFTLVAPRPLMSGAAVARTAALAHQRAPWVMLNHASAARLGLAEGDEVTVSHAAGEHRGPLRTSRRLHPGAVRINWAGAPTHGTGRVEP